MTSSSQNSNTYKESYTEFKIADSDAEREQARILINQVFPLRQFILDENLDLIPLESQKNVFVGKNKELIIFLIDNKVVGTALLELDQKSAYISYLTRHPNLPKEKKYGKALMDFSEDRAKKVYAKNKMRVSTVYHPECEQKSLEEWYTTELGYHFLQTNCPTLDQQQAWKPRYRNAKFKWFEKNLK